MPPLLGSPVLALSLPWLLAALFMALFMALIIFSCQV